MQENKELKAFAERLKEELPKAITHETIALSPWQQGIIIKAKINEILNDFKGGDR